MSQKMGVSGLKKILKAKEQKELVQIICDMYKDNKYIATYLESQLNGQNYNRELVEQYRQNIYKQFDYTRLRFDFKKAKSLVKEFCAIVKDKQSQADIYFAFVDDAVDLTAAIGDIDERFYNGVIDMFWKYVDTVNQLDDSYVQAYQEQLEDIIAKAGAVGWGFEDGLLDAYYNIRGLDV